MPYLEEIYRSARRMMGDPTRAEDVVQDVYLRAWRSFHTFTLGTNCRAWLYRILANSVHDYRSRWLKRLPADDSEEILERQEAPAPSLEQLTDREILDALDRLPDTFRDAVLLTDVEGFTYKETAEILGVKTGTVMSRLSRGRKQLRTSLRESARSYGLTAVAAVGES